jgi:hypothetical protein
MSTVTKLPVAEGPTFLDYIAHPLAALMPMMDDDAFTNLKADISRRGIEHAMTTYRAGPGNLHRTIGGVSA